MLGPSKKDKRIKKAFERIKEEFSDHLDSINANTNEIQTNFEHMNELNAKVNKMSERLDDISLFIQQAFNGAHCPIKTEEKFVITPLNEDEKLIFMYLYDIENHGYTTYEEVADKSGYSTHLTVTYLRGLIAKGIPIIKRYINNRPQITLDPRFKEEQAKHNILEINSKITQKVRENAHQI